MQLIKTFKKRVTEVAEWCKKIWKSKRIFYTCNRPVVPAGAEVPKCTRIINEMWKNLTWAKPIMLKSCHAPINETYINVFCEKLIFKTIKILTIQFIWNYMISIILEDFLCDNEKETKYQSKIFVFYILYFRGQHYRCFRIILCNLLHNTQQWLNVK